MSDQTHNDLVRAALDEPKRPSRMSLRRKRAERIVEPESKVERPSTVVVFQASPTSVAGALAKLGVSLDITLVWGQHEQPGPEGKTSLASLTAAPVFVVGAGRQLLGELLDRQTVLHVGSHGEALFGLTQAIQRNWASLAREGFPEQYWYKRIGDEFSADRAAEAGSHRWVEVVDPAELPIETLDRLFPRCLVVNVVGGRLHGGLRHTRPSSTLTAGRYLEVRVADLKANPELVKEQVLDFLGCESAPIGDEVA